MKKLTIAVLLFTILMSFNQCSTDFDMYAEYKDVTIVYGILDYGADTTWVKVTKAFTGPGNALLIAQNPDSSNYPYKLDVNLVGRKNGSDLDPIVLDTITIHNKALTEIIIDENGDTTILNPFYSPDQLVYYAVHPLDLDAVYTLNINKKDEKITASTAIVDDFYITKPNFRINFSLTTDGQIEWRSALNGKRNEVYIRFNYKEYAPGYTDTLQKSVDWPLGVVDSKTDDGGEDLEKTYSGEAFYNRIESEIEPIEGVERWADYVDVTIACGSTGLATYLDINTGSSSLLEEVPVYTNINGGYGIFSSRNTIVKTVQLSFASETILVSDYDLGFKYKSK